MAHVRTEESEKEFKVSDTDTWATSSSSGAGRNGSESAQRNDGQSADEMPVSRVANPKPSGQATGAGRQEPFRFLHAGDLMLHVPLSGLSEVPPTWQSTLASAAYTAATRVFDAAIAERVAFLILSGNVVDLDYGGPRAIAFLLAQFERLAQRGIEVVWCGGQHDRLERWPSSIELPTNVHILGSTLVDTLTIKRGEKCLATIFGASFDPHRTSWKDFQAAGHVGFPIGVTHGSVEAARLAGLGIRYWALGGKPTREIVSASGMTIAYPGTPQGRHASAVGPHGAILVACEADGQCRTQAVDCEVARWMKLGLSVSESIHTDALKDLLAERALQTLAKLPDTHLLVDWQIATTGDYSQDFRQRDHSEKLLKWLRHEFSSSPGLWSVRLTLSAPQNLPKGWQDEDTILGDFLREVSRYRQEVKLPFHLAHYAGGQEEIEGVTRLTRLDPAQRETLLDAVMLDGIDRLGGNQT